MNFQGLFKKKFTRTKNEKTLTGSKNIFKSNKNNRKTLL